jgi:hypothetical protein
MPVRGLTVPLHVRTRGRASEPAPPPPRAARASTTAAHCQRAKLLSIYLSIYHVRTRGVRDFTRSIHSTSTILSYLILSCSALLWVHL